MFNEERNLRASNYVLRLREIDTKYIMDSSNNGIKGERKRVNGFLARTIFL